MQLNESPVFLRIKAEGKTSKAPLTEAFGQWKNLKIVILALVGLTAGVCTRASSTRCSSSRRR